MDELHLKVSNLSRRHYASCLQDEAGQWQFGSCACLKPLLCAALLVNFKVRARNAIDFVQTQPSVSYCRPEPLPAVAWSPSSRWAALLSGRQI